MAKKKDSEQDPVADYDKHTGDVEDPEVETPEGPHGHPFQPTSAEPVLVTHGGDSDEARGQTTGEQRKAGDLVKISQAEAYDDEEFNPVANADVPGHKGGPDAEGGSERLKGGVEGDDAHDEKGENLEYDWKSGEEA